MQSLSWRHISESIANQKGVAKKSKVNNVSISAGTEWSSQTVYPRIATILSPQATVLLKTCKLMEPTSYMLDFIVYDGDENKRITPWQWTSIIRLQPQTTTAWSI